MTCSSLIFSLPKTLVFKNLPPPPSSLFSSNNLNLISSLQFQFQCLTINTKEKKKNVRSVASELEEDARDSSPDLKLFVGNLPFTVTSATLAQLFGTAGNVDLVEVIYDKLSGKSRGFAFVTMSTVDEAQAAQQHFNGYELQGRPLRVNSGPPPPKEDGFSRSPRGGESSYGSSRGESTYGGRGRGESSYGGGGRGSLDSSNKLYIGNLSWGVDDMALETLFGQKGKVMEAKVVYDRDTGRSRGFGFVTYSSADELNSAIDSLDGADLDGRSIRVTVAESKPRRSF